VFSQLNRLTPILKALLSGNPFFGFLICPMLLTRYLKTAWKPLNRLLWQHRGILIATPTVAGLVIAVRLTGLFQTLEWSALDFYFRSRPVEAPDQRIVIVGINEHDLKHYGWPIADHTLAQLIKKLNQQKPKAIGLDLYRNLPVGSGYTELVKTFAATPNLIGIRKVVGDRASAAVDPAPSLQKLGQVANNDMVVDADGKLRRGLLYLTDQQNENIFSLSLTLAWLYLQDHDIQPEITPDRQLKLGKALFPAFAANDGSYVNAEANGYQVLMNFRGPRGSFATVSMQDVLEGQVPANFFRDRIVLIGGITESLRDLFYTPYSSQFNQISPPTPGVELHAQLTSQILSSALQGRSSIKTLAEWQEWLWISSWSLLGAALVWYQRTGRKPPATLADPTSTQNAASWQSLYIVLSILVAGGGVMGISYAAFLASWWVPVMPPLLALSGSAIAVTGYVAQTAAEMRRTMGRYLTDEVVASLLETPGGLNLEGEKRKVTTLMSDLRGFTAISERLSPERVVKLLNLHLEVMTKVIRFYGGTINDVTGDGIVVFFGAPTQKPDDAERAVACAIAMQLAMVAVNQKNQLLDLPNLEMGIGINTGEVVVGNIGSQEHAKYTAIGSHVNLAARVESFTVGGQILIAQSTFSETQAVLSYLGQTQVYMKGVELPVSIYDVNGIGGQYNLLLPQAQDTLIPLAQPLPVQYHLLDGKHLNDQLLTGHIVQLSTKMAEIRSDQTIAPLSNLKLQLPNYPAADMYAKVITKAVADGSGFYVRFTMISPEVEALFNRFQAQAHPDGVGLNAER
jgi:adenylate cyclase